MVIIIDTRNIMERYNIRPVKSLGQNFLIDNNLIEEIVCAAELDENDLVIEVGPGLGVMTEALAQKAGKVIAIEIDQKLLPALANITLNYKNVEIICNDILKTNIYTDIIEKYFTGNIKRVKVVANLPYYITTPVIMKFLEEEVPHLHSMIFMVQEEVGERMAAGPGGKEYGALSVAVGFFSKAEILFSVPPSSFIPKPGVNSCVIRLEVHETPPIFVEDQNYFFKVVKGAFGQRRKTLANALSNASYVGVNRDQVYEAIEYLGKTPLIRGETLTPNEFGKLSNYLWNKVYK